MRSAAMTRRRARQAAALLAIAVLVAALPAAAQDDRRASREREALRRAQQELRTQQERQGELQREKAKLSADLDEARAAATKIGEQSAAAQGRLRASQGELERLRAELQDQRAALAAQRQSTDDERRRLEERAAQAEEKLASTRVELAERTAANGSVASLLQQSVGALEKAEGANRELYRIANEALDAYRNKGLGESIAQHDPFFGLKEVEIENRSEALRARMATLRVGARRAQP